MHLIRRLFGLSRKDNSALKIQKMDGNKKVLASTPQDIAEIEPADRDAQLNESSTRLKPSVKRTIKENKESSEKLAEIDGNKPANKKRRLDEETAWSPDSVKCRICLDVVTSSVMRSLPCAHVFHQNCLLRWLEVSKICPFCKWPIAKQTNDQLAEEMRALREIVGENAFGMNGNDYLFGDYSDSEEEWGDDLAPIMHRNDGLLTEFRDGFFTFRFNDGSQSIGFGGVSQQAGYSVEFPTNRNSNESQSSRYRDVSQEVRYSVEFPINRNDDESQPARYRGVSQQAVSTADVNENQSPAYSVDHSTNRYNEGSQSKRRRGVSQQVVNRVEFPTSRNSDNSESARYIGVSQQAGYSVEFPTNRNSDGFRSARHRGVSQRAESTGDIDENQSPAYSVKYSTIGSDDDTHPDTGSDGSV